MTIIMTLTIIETPIIYRPVVTLHREGCKLGKAGLGRVGYRIVHSVD